MMISRSLKYMVDDNCTVDLALERRFWSLFRRWEWLTTIDGKYSHKDYDYAYKIYNPCPAAMIENRWVSHNRMPGGQTFVPLNRVSVFASSLCVPLAPGERVPYVCISDKDRAEALKIHKKVSRPWIYFQDGANELYRSWIHSEGFCLLAKRSGISIIAHGVKDSKLVDKCIGNGTDILTSCALIEAADMVVTPDSMALHAAAAFGTPCVAIFGPIGASTRTMFYPNCTTIMPDGFECMPCWRNQSNPCMVSHGNSSSCLDAVTPKQVLSTVLEKLGTANSLSKQHKPTEVEGDDNVAW